ncbi:MAG: hypothetical protein AAGK04_03005 [Planctomycetota bacterium]
MRKKSVGLIATLGLAAAGVSWASARGLGLPQPSNNPPSIREESNRLSSSGTSGTRYFVGGGIIRGK